MLAHALLLSSLALRAPRLLRREPPAPPTRVAVLGGGFGGLTAARVLAADPRLEVLLVDQREYFEYTPGILRAWVEPSVHPKLVNPIRRLLRSDRARFQRVPPGYAARVTEPTDGTAPLRFTISRADEAPLVSYDCDYAVLATGGELSPISDDRLIPDGTILARRRRLREQARGLRGRSGEICRGDLLGRSAAEPQLF